MVQHPFVPQPNPPIVIGDGVRCHDGFANNGFGFGGQALAVIALAYILGRNSRCQRMPPYYYVIDGTKAP